MQNVYLVQKNWLDENGHTVKTTLIKVRASSEYAASEKAYKMQTKKGFNLADARINYYMETFRKI